MNQNPAETEIGVVKDIDNIESLLRGFWERVQTIGELVKQLRRDNKSLLAQVEQLEAETGELRAKVHEKDLEYRRLRVEHDQLATSQNADFISAHDRENLKDKIRELISRINSHL